MSFRGRSVASVDLFGFPRRRKKEDLMYETAKQLMDTATPGFRVVKLS